MQVILSHVNLDFDGFASMLAAQKLYPKAKIVLPTRQCKSVERFLAIYRDSITLYYPNQIDWDTISEIIIVDIASLHRVGEVSKFINIDTMEFIVYDHHPPSEHNVAAKRTTIALVGATVTLLLEEIREKNLSISSFEATIFALGLYTDTGSFTYLNTTPRDLNIGGYLLEMGANLEIISKFSESPLQEEEQLLLHSLIQQSEEHYFEGVNILIAFHQQNHYTGGLALLARKALERTGTDALIFVVEMGKQTFIVGRSTSHLVDILPIIKRLGGGGHPKAASAMIKNGDFQEILAIVRTNIQETIKPSLTAKDIMSSPVKVISTATSIEDAQKMMHRYGHTGFPVLENDKLVGIISRRDIDKAKHHGLGHAPVKGYMSTNPITIHSNMSIEEVQNLMIAENVGRLPVLKDKQLIGIISRTNVIEALHGEKINIGHPFNTTKPIKVSLVERLDTLITEEIFQLLIEIAHLADQLNYSAFMIGGIVRDLVIGRKNEDIDIVVEGNGITFAHNLAEKLGGVVRGHEKFGTATWKHPSGLKIDITSARTEYYDYPAALPTVEMSSLKEDLFRRDFTINAMAIQINKNDFGKLIDFFHGYNDIQQKIIRVLYNLSFVEDPTRILRAVRFETRFGYEMDKHTLELAQISVDKISSTSKPRLAHELNILLNEEHPVESLYRLYELGVLHYLIGPNICDENSLAMCKQFKEVIDEVLFTIPVKEQKQLQKGSWISYIAILFANHDNSLQQAKEFALNTDDLKVINEIISLLNKDDTCPEMAPLGSLHQLYKNYQLQTIICFAILKKLTKEQVTLLKNYLIERQKIPQLLDGNDLKSLNIKPGPIYSQILHDLESAFLNKQIVSKDDAQARVSRDYL